VSNNFQHKTAQQVIAAELLILIQIEVDLVATVSVIGSGFANPQSAEFKRWAAQVFVVFPKNKR
jgi:hypothetical protein